MQEADLQAGLASQPQEDAEQILSRQLAFIGQLQGAVRQRTIEIYKKQYGAAVEARVPGSEPRIKS